MTVLVVYSDDFVNVGRYPTPTSVGPCKVTMAVSVLDT
jgi:hypothetical protein